MIDRDLIKRALAEDLQGGQDITSVATMSGSEKVVADFVSRKAGVVAGIDMASAVSYGMLLNDTRATVSIAQITYFVSNLQHFTSFCLSSALLPFRHKPSTAA